MKEKTNFWSKLIGSPEIFSLESRIFHSISVSITILMAFYVPYNLYAGLYIGSISAFTIGLFFSHQYYYSRFKSKPHSNILFGLIGILLLSINYFSNSGIHGSTDLIWPIYLLLVFAISPYQHHLKWLALYVIVFLALHIIEYNFPGWVKYPFTIGKGQFIDRITAFPMPIVGIYVIIKFIRQNYDKERKAAEEKTIAIEISRAELEKSNTEKSKMMSIISHDLRTPLLNIQNYLVLLNEQGVNSEERVLLEKSLLNTTNNAIEMLSNLLHWSKSQMKGSSVNLVHTHLNETLLSTFEMEKTNALKKEIALNFDVPPELKVIVDVNMLQLVVRNLISNAIKFTPNKGLIAVNAEIIGNECKITITDSGKGISKEKQENIFSIKAEPEYGTNHEKGVGLGLVLCKEFIEHQNGRIGFESNLNLGSSFFIFIPLAPEFVG